MSAVAVGCASTTPANPSFPLTPAAADRALDADAAHPRRLRRPVVVVGGFLDPGFAAALLAADVRKYTGDDRVIDVQLFTCWTLDGCRDHVVRAVDAAFPSADPAGTTEVDVVGFSLGGLAARYAAAPGGPRRLRLARLFTISSPLRGATCTTRLPWDLHPMKGPLRPGSAFLAGLNGRPETYPTCSYVCLGDDEVGAENASLPGTPPWWVAGPAVGSPHNSAFRDPRILADVAARLRGDRPFTAPPPTPLPGPS